MSCSNPPLDSDLIDNGTLTVPALQQTGEDFALECDIGYYGNTTDELLCDEDRSGDGDWSNIVSCSGLVLIVSCVLCWPMNGICLQLDHSYL